MKFYVITIKPTAGFGTPLKGDTFFGHFCWQVAYDSSLVEGGLDKQVPIYPEKPFAVFSSAFPKLKKDGGAIFILKRPDLPFSFMLPWEKDKMKNMQQKKDFKKKKWLFADEKLRLDMNTAKFISDQELLKAVRNHLPPEALRQLKKMQPTEFMKVFAQSHNSINRMTQTTGTDMFAPYTKENIYYFPETLLVIFVLIEESATDIDRVMIGLKRIGNWGFGRDASTGLGQFEVCEANELVLPNLVDSNACYTLAPCVPEKDVFKETFFTPFVRYGKHGDRLANFDNPFKNPVIMADEGAVFIPNDKDLINKPYIGQAITHVSKTMPETVVQGYAPYLPLKLEI